MATMVHCLHAMSGKLSSTETVKLQLAGCALVTVLSRVGLLDFTRKSEMLSVEILIELMNVLKLPVTDRPFIQEWCANFHGRITMNRYANSVDMCLDILYLLYFCTPLMTYIPTWPLLRPELVHHLQTFWGHMAKRDRMHFDIIPLLLEVSGKLSEDDAFQIIRCTQSTFLSSFPGTRIKE